MKVENSYQENIVTVFDNNLKPVISGLLPETLTETMKESRIEAMRDFMTTLTHEYNQDDKEAYDENRHVFKVPSSLKENPSSDRFDLQHDVVQLTVSSICPVRDKEVLPYINLYADNVATVMVGDMTLEQNPNRYDRLNQLGNDGLSLLNDVFFTGNREKLEALKQAVSEPMMNPELLEQMETAKTRG